MHNDDELEGCASLSGLDADVESYRSGRLEAGEAGNSACGVMFADTEHGDWLRC